MITHDIGSSLPFNQRVVGSIPTALTKQTKDLMAILRTNAATKAGSGHQGKEAANQSLALGSRPFGGKTDSGRGKRGGEQVGAALPYPWAV
jgi:hypothetical protein